jgi:hypothetical protein
MFFDLPAIPLGYFQPPSQLKRAQKSGIVSALMPAMAAAKEKTRGGIRQNSENGNKSFARASEKSRPSNRIPQET